MKITTSPEMNKSLIRNLILRGDNISLYAIQRITELEEQVNKLNESRNITKDDIEDDGTIPLKIPVGQFIIDNDIPHVSLADGAYYHYANVCRLLNIYKKECTENYVNSLKEILQINDNTIDKKELDKALDKCGKIAKKVLKENNQI
jgi:hypothetical protein